MTTNKLTQEEQAWVNRASAACREAQAIMVHAPPPIVDAYYGTLIRVLWLYKGPSYLLHRMAMVPPADVLVDPAQQPAAVKFCEQISLLLLQTVDAIHDSAAVITKQTATIPVNGRN